MLLLVVEPALNSPPVRGLPWKLPVPLCCSRLLSPEAWEATDSAMVRPALLAPYMLLEVPVDAMLAVSRGIPGAASLVMERGPGLEEAAEVPPEGPLPVARKAAAWCNGLGALTLPGKSCALRTAGEVPSGNASKPLKS